MRRFPGGFRLAAAVCLGAVLGFAQASAPADALLHNKELLELANRCVQLVESTMVATPALSNTAGPALDNARQALASMRRTPANAQDDYRLLNALKGYLLLADQMPAPWPPSDIARRQMNELRDGVARLDAHFTALLAAHEKQLHNPDPDDLTRYAALNERVSPPSPERPRVVFMGDSITDSWRLNEYFPDRDYINRGISGQTTGEMLGRFQADVLDLHPAAVLILGGTNDIARGIAVGAIENNLRMMAALAEHDKIAVLIASLLPVSDYHKDVDPLYERTRLRPPETIRALNRWIQGFCGERGYTYVDYYANLVDAAGFLRPELSDDGLHPNGRGYREMGTAALTAIEKSVHPPQHRRRRRRPLNLEE